MSETFMLKHTINRQYMEIDRLTAANEALTGEHKYELLQAFQAGREEAAEEWRKALRESEALNAKYREAMGEALAALLEVSDCQEASCCDQDRLVYHICRQAAAKINALALGEGVI